MEQEGQRSQLKGSAGKPKPLGGGFPLFHGRNSVGAYLGRLGELDHKKQEEIWGLEVMKRVTGK